MGIFDPSQVMRKIQEETWYQKSVKRILEIIESEIHSIEDSLDSEHHVAIKLASFGESVSINVNRITAVEPQYLIFEGVLGDQPTKLIQHINQLNFLITVVKISPELPARRIGFYYDQFPEE